MTKFLGEYYCRLDNKGRVMVPVSLLKQIPEEEKESFVVNRGFEKCLILYTKAEWNKITEEINNLNTYIRQNRDFVRYFFRGATELNLDNVNRLLFPKLLLEYAGIKKDIVLFAHTNKIEIWDKDAYDNLLSNEPEDFATLAEKVMGKQNDNHSE